MREDHKVTFNSVMLSTWPEDDEPLFNRFHTGRERDQLAHDITELFDTIRQTHIPRPLAFMFLEPSQYRNVHCELMDKCVRYVMAIRGTPWAYDLSNSRIDLKSPLPPKRAIPLEIVQAMTHDHRMIVWNGHAATVLPDKDFPYDIWLGRPHDVVGVEIPSHIAQDQLSLAHAMRAPALDRIKIPMEKVERVCAYCAGTIPALTGIDMGLMSAVLGCEKCGMPK